ncbi:MAG: DNA polymerase IV [Candidatus Micrarchaeaceae archaeon]
MRIIFLVDMDYFFAACEEVRRPEIRGKPVAVGADPKAGKGRGVVMTCNYEARKYGIKSGMPVSKAYFLCKDCIFIEPDFDYYERTSGKVMDILRGYADKFEQVSIDEAYLDASNRLGSYEEAETYAKRIKDRIMEELGLPCSIGISYNKLLAKMACQEAKPNGIKIVREGEGKKFLENMDIGELYGVGKKIREKLEKEGIKTIGQLAKSNVIELVEKFGKYGIELYNYSNGIDESEVVENYEVKSIGREYTFEKDEADLKNITSKYLELCDEAIKELKSKGFEFKTVTIKVRYYDFEEHIKSTSMASPSDSEEAARKCISSLVNGIEKGKKVRKIGVRFGGLVKALGQKKLSLYFS